MPSECQRGGCQCWRPAWSPAARPGCGSYLWKQAVVCWPQKGSVDRHGRFPQGAQMSLHLWDPSWCALALVRGCRSSLGISAVEEPCPVMPAPGRLDTSLGQLREVLQLYGTPPCPVPSLPRYGSPSCMRPLPSGTPATPVTALCVFLLVWASTPFLIISRMTHWRVYGLRHHKYKLGRSPIYAKCAFAIYSEC